MKRPLISHFICIETNEYFSIRASVHFSSVEDKKLLGPTTPWSSIGLLSSSVFSLKLVGLNSENESIFDKNYDSDHFGNFHIRIYKKNNDSIEKFQCYEISTHLGIELHLGTYIPTKILSPKKIIISDFDKTLVDTRYSKMIDMYRSLTGPIENFPTIEESIKLLNEYIKKDYHPFVLSASPHFYEDAIRDWLYQKKIYTSVIFLKDYREIFNYFQNDMTTKDLRTQGFYKLNHLANILLMTGIPEELILMGDGFESDTIIYLTFAMSLLNKEDPWTIWNNIKGLQSYRLTKQQDARFLNKLYQITGLLQKENRDPIIKIFIRCPKGQKDVTIEGNFFDSVKDLVTFYQA